MFKDISLDSNTILCNHLLIYTKEQFHTLVPLNISNNNNRKKNTFRRKKKCCHSRSAYGRHSHNRYRRKKAKHVFVQKATIWITMISSTEPHVQTVSNDGNFWQNKSNEKNEKKTIRILWESMKKKNRCNSCRNSQRLSEKMRWISFWSGKKVIELIDFQSKCECKRKGNIFRASFYLIQLSLKIEHTLPSKRFTSVNYWLTFFFHFSKLVYWLPTFISISWV